MSLTFVKFTRPDGDFVWINRQSVTRVYQALDAGDGTKVTDPWTVIDIGGSIQAVKEPIEEVFRRMSDESPIPSF